MEPVQPVGTARAARIMHAALVIGSILVGITFFFVLRRISPALRDAPLAVVTLITQRPSRLEGDGVS